MKTTPSAPRLHRWLASLNRLVLLLATAAVLVPSIALAATRTASQSGDWNLTATWGGNPVPVAGDTATISGAYTVTVSDAEACAVLNVQTSASAELHVTTGTLTLTGTTTLNTANANAVVIDSGGTFTTAGALTITSGTFNNNGTTVITGAATGASGTIINGSSASLTYGSTSTIGTQTYSASGNTVIYNRSGTQTCQTGNTYVNLSLGGTSAKTLTGVTAVTGNLALSGSATATLPSALTSIGGNLTLTGTSTATLGVSLTIGGYLSVGDGTTFTAGAYALTVTGTTTVGGGTSGTLTLSSATGTKTFTGDVTVGSGATWNESAAAVCSFGGSFYNNGAATMTISTGNHTFTAATPNIGGSSTLPLVTATFGNGTSGCNPTSYGAGGYTISTTLTVAANNNTFILPSSFNIPTVTVNGSPANTGDIAITGGVLTFGGAGQMNGGIYAGNIANSGTMNYNSSANQSFSGIISGAGVLAQGGAGTVTLSGANSYSSDTTVSAGTLKLGAANVIPNGSGKGNVNLSVSGAKLDVNGNSDTVNGLTGVAGTIVEGTSGTPTLTVGDNNQTSTFAGVIQNTAGTLSLIKTGTGTLTLSGTNTFSGGLYINAGTVAGSVSSNTNAFGGGGGTGTIYLGDGSSANNATLQLANANYDNPLVVPAGGTGTNTVLHVANGNGVLSGAVNLTNTLYLTESGSGYLNLSGNVTGTNSIITDSGSTDLVKLTGVNNVSYTGNVTARSGTLQVGGSTALGVGSTVQVNSGATLDISSGSSTVNVTIAGLTDNAGAGGTVLDNGNHANTLTLGGSGSYGFAGTIAQNVTTNLSLTKSGSGVQRLSGNNSYSGATTVSVGTLLVNGDSSSATNTVTVSAAGTLGGTGTIGGAVTNLSGSFLAPGNGTSNRGTLTLTNGLGLNGANLFFTLTNANTAGGTYDQLAITNGTFTVPGANNTIYLAAPAVGVQPGTYYLITNPVARTPGGTNFVLAQSGTTNWTTAGGQTFTLTNAANWVALNVSGPAAALPAALVWRGFVNGVWDTTTANWSPVANYADGNAVTFDNTALNCTVTGGSFSPASVTFNNSVSNYVVAANIGGAGSLTKNLTGTLTLTGTNTFTGDVTMGASGATAYNPLTLAGNGRLGSSTSKLLTGTAPRYLITIQDSAVATFTNILLNNQNGGTQPCRLNQTGGTLNCLGTGTGTSAAMQLGTGGTSVVTNYLSGGTLNVTNGDLALSLASAALNALVQSGGTANLKGVYFHRNGVLTLSAGTLNLGSDGMTRGTNLSTINLVGGTLGAFGNWSSSLDMNLTNTTTVNTLDSFDGATARSITLAGILSGSGDLTKTNAGTLVLSGTNTYTGNTAVNAGTLLVNGNSVGVTSPVTVSGSAAFGSSTNGTIGGLVAYQQGAAAMFTVTPIATGYSNSTYLTFASTSLFTNTAVHLNLPANLGNGTYVLATNIGTAPILSGAFTTAMDSGSIAGGGSAGVAIVGNNLVLSVSGVAGTASNPTNVSYTISGNSLQMTWPGDHLGWLLESNSVNLAITNDWFTILGTDAATNYNATINPANTNVFFRLRKP